jgi:DUF1365 family protein
MAMEHRYDWRFSEPGERLAVHMDNRDASGRVFDATLTLRRRPITARALRRVLLRYPAMTGRVFAAIYWQALKLWWKRCPFHPHPKHRLKPGASVS